MQRLNRSYFIVIIGFSTGLSAFSQPNINSRGFNPSNPGHRDPEQARQQAINDQFAQQNHGTAHREVEKEKREAQKDFLKREADLVKAEAALKQIEQEIAKAEAARTEAREALIAKHFGNEFKPLWEEGFKKIPVEVKEGVPPTSAEAQIAQNQQRLRYVDSVIKASVRETKIDEKDPNKAKVGWRTLRDKIKTHAKALNANDQGTVFQTPLDQLRELMDPKVRENALKAGAALETGKPKEEAKAAEPKPTEPKAPKDTQKPKEAKDA